MKTTSDENPDNSLFSVHRLALLAQMDRGALERRLHGIEPFRRDGKTRLYRLADVLPRMTQENRDDATARRFSEHKERQARADADTAELSAGRLAGALMLTADAKRLWQDGLTRIRQVILAQPGLTAKQRVNLAESIQQIRLRDEMEETD